MDFASSDRVADLLERVRRFIEEHVDPVEREADRGARQGGPPGRAVSRRSSPSCVSGRRPRACGTCSCPTSASAPGSRTGSTGCCASSWDAAPWRPMVFNCAAPDTGNMEILAEHGTPEQAERWLAPLLEGEIRSCFSMTEPERRAPTPPGWSRARSSMATNGSSTATSGSPRATTAPSVAIAMVVTDPDAPPHKRASMILVPVDAPGFEGVRPVPVMGHDEGPATGRCATRTAACPPRTCSASGARACDRPGPPRARPHPPPHARDRLGRAGLRADVPARARPRGVRRAAGREAVRAGLHGPVAHGDRLGPPDGPARGLEDGHRGQARRAPGDLDDQGDRGPDAPARARPGDAGARRARMSTTRRLPPCGGRAAGCGSRTARTRSTRW